MKKLIGVFTGLVLSLVLAFVITKPQTVNADSTILPGVSINGIDVSGLDEAGAQAKLDEYLNGLSTASITFKISDTEKVTTTFGDLGITWANSDAVHEALSAGNEGNVIVRYKAKKDIEVNGLNIPIDVSFNEASVNAFLENECAQFDKEVQNATLKRENGEFIIIDGVPGETVDREASLQYIENELFLDYVSGMTEVPLVVTEVDPEGSKEELSQIKDLLGTYTTKYASSGYNRSMNIANGCSLINGTVLYPGEEFSTYDTVKPFTEANGYYLAGSYLNGQVVDSVGGGICQVSTTLYNAVLRSELEIVERYNHSMIVTYVQKSGDAAIAESSGKDFKFKNNTEYPIFIEGYTEDKTITFNIYGVETRPSNRTIEFESKVLSETVPSTDTITADPSQPIGYISTSAAHIGYSCELWKVVYEDGEEVSREQINSSRYSPAPRTAIVGVSTPNPDYYNYMMNAIASGNVDTCKSAAAQIKALEAQSAQPQPQPTPEG